MPIDLSLAAIAFAIAAIAFAFQLSAHHRALKAMREQLQVYDRLAGTAFLANGLTIQRRRDDNGTVVATLNMGVIGFSMYLHAVGDEEIENIVSHLRGTD